MSLKQIIQLPTERLQLPKSKKIINVRPFTVKERTALQIAATGDKDSSISSTLERVVEACVTEKIKVRKLDLLDVEYLFLQILKNSTGRFIDVGYKCLSEYNNPETNEPEECGHHNDVRFDLNSVDFNIVDEDASKIFKITDDVALQFKKIDSNEMFKSFTSIYEAEEESDLVEEQKKKYINCLVAIIEGDDRSESSNFKHDDLWGLIEHLPLSIIGEIDDFISKVDRLSLKTTFKCHKCGTDHTIENQGIEDFLD